MDLVVDGVLCQATVTAEAEAALTMLERVPTVQRMTAGPTTPKTRRRSFGARLASSQACTLNSQTARIVPCSHRDS